MFFPRFSYLVLDFSLPPATCLGLHFFCGVSFFCFLVPVISQVHSYYYCRVCCLHIKPSFLPSFISTPSVRPDFLS